MSDFIQVFQQQQRYPRTAVISHFYTTLGAGERAAKYQQYGFSIL